MRSTLLVFVSLLLLGGCETVPKGIEEAHFVMAQRIQAEAPGDYFIGRRYFKEGFHFWGYIRPAGQPWSTAQLVVLNENQKLGPGREQLRIGSDNNYEYRLRGYFSGDKVYELVSNSFLPRVRPPRIRTAVDESAADLQKPVRRPA